MVCITMRGNGTIATPWDFETALASKDIKPGHTIYMRGGIYTASVRGFNSGSDEAGKGVFQVMITGAPGKNITIKPYKGEKVRINGGLEIRADRGGGYITVQDLEIAPTPTTRQFTEKSNVDYPYAVHVRAPGCKFYNNYIHDGQDVSIMDAAPFEFAGNVVLNNGFYTSDLDRWRDYGMYTSNVGGGDVLIQKNIFGPNAGNWGVNCYSDSDQHVQDYQVDDNIFYDSGVLFGNLSGFVRNNHLRRNHFYQLDTGARDDRQVRLGSADQPLSEGVICTDNYIVAKNNQCMRLAWIRGATVRRNKVIHLDDMLYGCTGLWTNAAGQTNDVDENEYIHMGDPAEFAIDGDAVEAVSFADWKTRTGYDANSTYSTERPAQNVIRYVTVGRQTMIAVYNWEGLESVPFAGSGTLNNALNFAETTTIDGSIPMTGWTVVKMAGHSELLVSNPYPDFGAFVLTE